MDVIEGDLEQGITWSQLKYNVQLMHVSEEYVSGVHVEKRLFQHIIYRVTTLDIVYICAKE